MDGSDYKEIDVLSMGQRCTAILPIILRHMERTIILDQPEDHLDNAFVVGTLVKSILSRSQTAQSIIIATHNPNIPVLGNAEMVLHMDSDGSRCFIRSSGSLTSPAIVDAITTIMEGGARLSNDVRISTPRICPMPQNPEGFLRRLRSDNNKERLEAARYFAEHAVASNEQLLREALARESVPWIKGALRRAIARLSPNDDGSPIWSIDRDDLPEGLRAAGIF